MRLTKLKLAGFKTFVDPTTVLMPGQLVGVVGPNGCGKSNIIDAVRWVLGESKASALRGESMTDVIFNGSGTRKPVGRASVELVFDNAAGKAAGQWSQYAEIAVKRVMERDGQSDYFINNLRCRRRDVIDLFLGTGLGPRAYAIIEQGMISRIIEARPEDLRLFLEEAAGITKYRERRRETEGRLEDARENLTRLEDIRNELGSRIERLESQAEVASRYHAFNDRLNRRQAQLWVLRSRLAREDAQRLQSELGELELRIDQESAALAAAGTALELTRSQHFTASDGLHAAQTEMYAANAEVTRLEGELRRAADTRQRLEAQLSQLRAELQNWCARAQTLEQDRGRWSDLAEHTEQRVALAQARHDETAQRLPEAEKGFADAEAAASVVRRELAQAEQVLRVEETHRANAGRTLDTLAQRRGRIEQERAQLIAPDREGLELARARCEALRERQTLCQDKLAEGQDALPLRQARLKQEQEAERNLLRELTALRARRDALADLQRKTAANTSVESWLKSLGLNATAPLWQQLNVAPGWEVAVEAVLRERLSAMPADDVEQLLRALDGASPQTLTLALPGSVAAPHAPEPDSLRSRLGCTDPRWSALLDVWLGEVKVCDSLGEAVRAGQPGPLVDRQGRMWHAGSLGFYAPDARTHGVIERKREIDQLEAELKQREPLLDASRARIAEAEQAVFALQERLSAARRENQELTQAVHAAQVEELKLAQAIARHDEKLAALSRDLDEVARSEEGEAGHRERAETEIERVRELIELQRARMDAALGAQREADNALREARFQDQAAARELQEAQFSGRECAAKLADIRSNLDMALGQQRRLETDIEVRQGERDGIDESVIDAQLAQALALRSQRERVLAGCRDEVEQIATQLKSLDEQRLAGEQRLTPLRSRLTEVQLKLQAAQLNAEQFDQRLQELQIDEARLVELAAEELKESALQAEINRLGREIQALGAVNLAALEELQQASERKRYLDAQSEDLNLAISTLEDAIRRIDRETRVQLRDTYDKVNAEFGRLFPELFGGGEARLVLTGEEILDAGVQVFAQPPGKRNSSIQLLSGGEKALTATALVFSMFQLNPAPFCMLDEVDAPLDDTNTERFCEMVKRMSRSTQFVYISHNKITMEMAQQLVGVTMQERGVSRVVEVDIEQALAMRDAVVAA